MAQNSRFWKRLFMSGFMPAFMTATLSAGSLPAKDDMVQLEEGLYVVTGGNTVALDVDFYPAVDGLEFIASRGWGKDHETLVATSVSGTMIHFAMMTAGFEPSSFQWSTEASTEDLMQEQSKGGSRLKLMLSTDSNPPLPIHEYLAWSNGDEVEASTWFFAGSYFAGREGNQFYAADRSLNIVAAYPALDMIMGPVFKVANPYRAGGTDRYLKQDMRRFPPEGVGGTLWILAP